VIKFNKPENLNGAELRIELAEEGIQLKGSFNDLNDIYVVGEDLFLNIDEEFLSKANEVVANHNGTIVAPKLSVEDKLASVGLSLEELKAALGGN
jgi:hypothetical protein